MSKRIIIFSTKGGVGKTLIATNLAVSMAKDAKQKVCLIDLDQQVVGDMARMLDLKPQRAMVDLMNFLKHHSAEEARKDDFLVKSSSLEVDFLPGILKAEQSPYLEPAKIKDVFDILDRFYDYIIVDAGGKGFSDVFVATLNQANLILMVVTPDILSVYQTKWAMDTLQFLHFPLSMVKIILNRAESASSIGWREVSASLPVDIVARIPSEGKVVGQAVNRGVPVVIDNPRTRVSTSIGRFAHELITDNKLFMERQEIDQLRVKDMSLLDRSKEFWQALGLTEPLGDVVSEAETDEMVLLKRRIHSRLIEDLNLKRIDFKIFSDVGKLREVKDKAEGIVSNLLAKEAGSFISSSEVRKKIIKDILDEALGLGPLEDLLADPTITDIMVNNKDEVYIERNGKIEYANKKFISNDQLKTIVDRIIAPIGRHIDESVPMVDARLPDGSRVNAIIPPLSLTGPTLTIRKFRKEKFTLEELTEIGSLNRQMAEFLRACVLCRKNFIISGATGSGKTTMLNVLSFIIRNNERIITIEDAAELKLNQEHWVRLEARPPNIEGKGAITIRDLFRNTLRMRPDRIIIGECRSNEAFDMLQAMNTGHDGSMTTLHANSTQDVLVRLDSMVLMSGVELPVRSIREMIASAIDLIVHTARLSDGTRKVVQITEASGMMEDQLHIKLEDIFVFKQTGTDSNGNVLGHFEACGYIPTFFNEIKIRGIPLDESIFKP